MTADIIMSVPWCCGDKDCKVGWHLASYWIDDGVETGYTVDNYSDGDHDPVEEADLPTAEDEAKAWIEYAKDVAAFGRDPLGNYNVASARKVKERWKFKFNAGIGGVYLMGARRAGKDYRWRELPEHVQRYLNLKGSARLRDFENWEAFTKVIDVKPRRWLTQHIDHEKPRKANVVKAELKRAARRHLRRAKEGTVVL